MRLYIAAVFLVYAGLWLFVMRVQNFPLDGFAATAYGLIGGAIGIGLVRLFVKPKSF